MVVVALFAILLPLSSSLAAPDSMATTTSQLIVQIEGLRNDNGNADVFLFRESEEKSFPKNSDNAFRHLTTKISNGKARVVFDSLAIGVYAVAVNHDENGNGKLDTNWLGMPKEGVGSSNNPKTHFGPPSFQQAKLKIEKGTTTTTIKMVYL